MKELPIYESLIISNVLVITDLDRPDCESVTNSMMDILSVELEIIGNESFERLSGIIYQDTEKEWCSVFFDPQKHTVGFKHIPCKDMKSAITHHLRDHFPS